MDHRPRIVLGNLDRGVGGGRGRTADQQWHLEALTLHLLGDIDHFVQRGSDQTRQADDVGTELDRLGENLVTRNHHAHVRDFEAIAGKHHADDVFADVVDVALHRGDEKTTRGTTALGEAKRFFVS